MASPMVNVFLLIAALIYRQSFVILSRARDSLSLDDLHSEFQH
jgi:hypothetical protein